MLDFTVIIPARYASSRFPGKPLADIAGKPMVVHVAQRAAQSGAAEVLIATDHPGIAAAAKQYGFEAVMTRGDHASGTDRVAEVSLQRDHAGHHVVVNIQGDEPLIAPGLIREVAQNLLDHADAAVSTACHPIRDAADITNPNVVKVVLDHQGYALYFSRAPIPYARDAFAGGIASVPAGLPAYRHIGIYGYRAGFLKRYSHLASSPLEQFEALEQLRVLWHGYKISVALTQDAAPPGIDTPEDLQRLRDRLLAS
jgi:3-deoxy-manno-octulosonate cytidylyltransferase (CMP-KDO synthetase)